MKKAAVILLTLLSSTSTAQLLNNGVSGSQLPTCGQQCGALTTAQSTCGSSWSCFCSNIYKNSGGNLASVCQGSCPNPNDNAAVVGWYTANCGSDNGAKEHSADSGGQQTTTAGASAPSSSTTSTGVDSTESTAFDHCGGSWWSCHWKWIVMIIIIAIGLIALGFGARWLKKRHDRKRDQNSSAFNAGITSRSAHIADDKAVDSSSDDNSTPFPPAANGNSPARTRENFMPYGYGYARSENRHDHAVNESESSVTRGGTPFEEMEKGPSPWKNSPNDESGVRGKMRRVLVRERSLGTQ